MQWCSTEGGISKEILLAATRNAVPFTILNCLLQLGHALNEITESQLNCKRVTLFGQQCALPEVEFQHDLARIWKRITFFTLLRFSATEESFARAGLTRDTVGTVTNFPVVCLGQWARFQRYCDLSG